MKSTMGSSGLSPSAYLLALLSLLSIRKMTMRFASYLSVKQPNEKMWLIIAQSNTDQAHFKSATQGDPAEEHPEAEVQHIVRVICPQRLKAASR